MFLLLADINSLVGNTTQMFERAAGLILVCVLGFMALKYVSRERYGAAAGLCVIALIPAKFVFDPVGAGHLLSSTAKALGG